MKKNLTKRLVAVLVICAMLMIGVCMVVANAEEIQYVGMYADGSVSVYEQPDTESPVVREMESGEFVINLVTEDLVKACDWCGVKSGRDVDKSKEMTLTEYTSDLMNTPAIDESPVNIWCKVVKTEKLGSHDMFLANVVGVTVDEKYMDENGKFALEKTNLITYSHGEYYSLGKMLGTFGYSVKKNKNIKKRGNKK